MRINKILKAILLCAVCTAVAITSVGCGKDTAAPDDSSNTSSTAATQPTTLTQELLAKRGIAFDASDYKTFVGGDGLLTLKTVFPDADPVAAGGDLSSVFVSNGGIYKFRCDMTLPGGQNCVKVGDMPSSADVIYLHSRDFGGAELDTIFKGGSRFTVQSVMNSGPYTAKQSNFGMIYFTHTYKYTSDGTLEEIAGFADKITFFDAHLVLADGVLYAYSSREIRDGDLYFRDKNNGFIVWEVDVSEMSDGETPQTVFNGNILATDKAFYKIIYADVPESLTDRTARRTNSDGTPAQYLPKFGGGDRYKLKKIELLSKYYNEVATITQSYVITKDYTILPIKEIIPSENKYTEYDFGDIEIPEEVHSKIN